VQTLHKLDDADNVRYDAPRDRVVVGYSDALLVSEAAGKATVPLKGHPESFQLTRDGQRIYVNVPSAHHVAVVDGSSKKVLETWPVKEAEANFPMALDEEHHRLLIVCRKPAKLLALDLESGRSRHRRRASAMQDDHLVR
jgi:hypothetical protein